MASLRRPARLLTILLATAVVMLCPASNAFAQTVVTPSRDPIAGARLFQSRGCVRCHAVDGAGGTSGPDLARTPRPRSFYDVAAAMWNHLPQMGETIRRSRTETPYFTSDEMSDLVAFLYPHAFEASDDTSADPQRRDAATQHGRELVGEKGCLACHALSGRRGPSAGSLDQLKGLDSPWSVMASMWNHAFLMELKVEGQSIEWPRITGDEMTDLVTYLRVLAYGRDRGR